MTTTINTIKDRLAELAAIFAAYYANPSDDAWDAIDGDALVDEEEALEAELEELKAELEEEYESDAYDSWQFDNWRRE